MDINKTCCFTGHRKINKAEASAVSNAVLQEIIELAEKYGYTDFIAGGALGFDTIAALAVKQLQAMKPDYGIKLHLYLPCRNQTRNWSEQDIATYESLKLAADTVTYISEQYSTGAMFKRNRAMVNDSSVVVSYCTNPDSGGTAYTIKYAYETGRNVILLPKGRLTREHFSGKTNKRQ